MNNYWKLETGNFFADSIKKRALSALLGANCRIFRASATRFACSLSGGTACTPKPALLQCAFFGC